MLKSFVVLYQSMIAFILGFCLLFAAPAFAVSHRLVAEGGPYIVKAPNKVQKFNVPLKVPEANRSDQLWLTLYNGFGGRPGFSWVRVFLAPAGELGEVGTVIADERTFMHRHSVTVDVTGRFSQQASNLFIEGAGPSGADFSWALTGSGSDLSILDTTDISPGKSFLIHGTGFSGNVGENQVFIGGKKAKVTSATTRILEVMPPSDIAKGAKLTVSVNGKTSNEIMVAISQMPPHLIDMSPYGAPAGFILTIRGANFSRLASNNVVCIGPYRARVFKVLDTGTLLCYVPDWGGSSGTLPVTVITNGVRSDNSLSFWCVEHAYGGDPNSAGYQVD